MSRQSLSRVRGHLSPACTQARHAFGPFLYITFHQHGRFKHAFWICLKYGIVIGKGILEARVLQFGVSYYGIGEFFLNFNKNSDRNPHHKTFQAI